MSGRGLDRADLTNRSKQLTRGRTVQTQPKPSRVVLRRPTPVRPPGAEPHEAIDTHMTYGTPPSMTKVLNPLQNSSSSRVPLMTFLFLFMIPRLSIPLYDLKSG